MVQKLRTIPDIHLYLKHLAKGPHVQGLDAEAWGMACVAVLAGEVVSSELFNDLWLQPLRSRWNEGVAKTVEVIHQFPGQNPQHTHKQECAHVRMLLTNHRWALGYRDECPPGICSLYPDALLPTLYQYANRRRLPSHPSASSQPHLLPPAVGKRA